MVKQARLRVNVTAPNFLWTFCASSAASRFGLVLVVLGRERTAAAARPRPRRVARCGAMHPLVRDLYKKLMTVGRDYPAGLEHVRARAKREIFGRRELTHEVDIKKAVRYGRYMLREMMGVIQLKKYRTLRSRYAPQDDEPPPPPPPPPPPGSIER